jgi:hypothetical protein
MSQDRQTFPTVIFGAIHFGQLEVLTFHEVIATGQRASASLNVDAFDVIRVCHHRRVDVFSGVSFIAFRFVIPPLEVFRENLLLSRVLLGHQTRRLGAS